MSRKYNVAVVGANGAVGEEILAILEELNFPLNKLVPLASQRSVGKSVDFKGRSVPIQELTNTIFQEENIEIALFSAGGSVSAQFAHAAVEAGAVVIDNTSHFRMDKNTPLVVPEVNPEDIAQWTNTGIIANPNCSTIQMVQTLKPLNDVYGLQRVDVSTYQATSGAGKTAMEELVTQMQSFFAFKLDECEHKSFAHQIALNVIPQIDVFEENGYTKEEMKMVNETTKIMHKNIELSATCVRVPTLRGHAEALTLTFDKDVNAKEAREILSKAPNIIILDKPQESLYPMPSLCMGLNETFVGRIRVDNYRKNILHLFVVADNLRVGAATNAVRIAQKWVEMQGEIND
ncbi:MAG: aspartate-semialdehyde dehydrogenase [Epsilonproteobacteria bacterium]|nr:aspartate-semialdehyde dehydrogenase [Campylobacterota bacterium]OIO16642.1 MAG: aspartate-semialdehyde dehydrogenase [Helicobacteraceae bacterium CG1_02_36_14]PIP09846.1 MAG: aspartate-semialdehyde dehydrogenase [Sulfurimonas sp. CG23_combo_of_CG06-09_8_20_14_all_36_33]PIS24061.1 MAG: aspartate-semialdehyde dehydrogenase [Sulfurimonas sp. CG08_land_8_20_14_0_20_36_33]PIU35545.1 MAG: aspartate-semialdehyde dehydrogenase [Sulfurimonas sp. CG07_land_8_20_14_0_80_36_56]PIV05466.1 MAG: aspartat